MSYVVTVVCKKDQGEKFWEQCRELLGQYSIVNEKPLSGQRVVDFYVESQPDRELCQRFEEDMVVQQVDMRSKKLVVFDMDSTLIQQEVIDMIAAHGNIEPQVAAITESAMRGEIDFTESLKQRVALLKGISGDVFEKLKSEITFTPGGKELCSVLKKQGFKLAVLSGGFIPLAKYVQNELGLDYAYANNLQQENGVLTGVTYDRIINSTAKAQLLQEIAQTNGIPIQQTIAVGDGSNDLEMMGVAGYGIAFCAKPIVQQRAPGKLNSGTLKDLLYIILGYNDEEISRL